MEGILLWGLVFAVSTTVLIKGADWLLWSSERLGLAAGFSPFVVGVLIVSLGTSFPELIAAFFAAFQGVSEFAAANAVGSNLANILLVVGFSAVIAGRLAVSKSLIDIELPLLAVGTVLFLGVAWDGNVSGFEAALMIAAYGIYLLYTLFHKEEVASEDQDVLPGRSERRGHISHKNDPDIPPRLSALDIGFFVGGVILLAAGSKYLIDSVVALSELLQIGVGVITITAVAIGTSLPELFVSVKAALQKHTEVALGNVFGSNAFNMMIVVGLPALFFGAEIDEQTYAIGLPALAAVTLIFIISGISRRIHIWEGAMYLVLYLLFLVLLWGAL